LSNAKYKREGLRPPAEHLDKLLVDMVNDLPNRPRDVRNTRIRRDPENVYYDQTDDEVLTDYGDDDGVGDGGDDDVGGDGGDDDGGGDDGGGDDGGGDGGDGGGGNPPPFNLVNEFRSRVPKWGGIIDYNNRRGVNLVNTCNIDYFLLALWLMSKIQPNFVNRLPRIRITQDILQIIDYIERKNWNKAKEIFFTRVSRQRFTIVSNTLSTFGSERQMFLNHVSDFQKHSLIQVCSNGCIYNNIRVLRDDESDIYIRKKDDGSLEIHSLVDGNCEQCLNEIRCKIQLNNLPNFLIIQTINADIYLHELPLNLNVNDSVYKFLCATVAKPGHFVGIFNLNNDFYKVDDLSNLIDPQFQLLNRYVPNNGRPRRGTNNQFYYYENVTISVAVYSVA
jgi:hypothetical protein